MNAFKPRERKARELFSSPQGRKHNPWRERENSSGSRPFSIPACHSPKRKKRKAEIFSFNSFLECSEPDAQGFIFTELDHKWDQAPCSVICHQITRMQCPNMERMSCPKHLFLAMSFPAWRSKLELTDKHRSWTPSPPHSSPPLTDSTQLTRLAHSSCPYFLAWLGLR